MEYKMNNHGTIILINNSELPQKEVTLGYIVKRRKELESEKIVLFRVSEKSYRHPDAPDDALIKKIEFDEVFSAYPNQVLAAPLKLIEVAQENLKIVFSVISEK